MFVKCKQILTLGDTRFHSVNMVDLIFSLGFDLTLSKCWISYLDFLRHDLMDSYNNWYRALLSKVLHPCSNMRYIRRFIVLLSHMSFFTSISSMSVLRHCYQRSCSIHMKINFLTGLGCYHHFVFSCLAWKYMKCDFVENFKIILHFGIFITYFQKSSFLVRL